MNNICRINGYETDMTEVYEIYLKVKIGGNRSKIVGEMNRYLDSHTELSGSATATLVDKIFECDGIPLSFSGETDREFKAKQIQINSMLHCPKCNSVSVTTGQRGFSLLSGFLGSSKVVNRCGSCGYTWKP